MKGWNNGIRFFTTPLFTVRGEKSFKFEVVEEEVATEIGVASSSAMFLVASPELTLAVLAPATGVCIKVNSGPIERPGTVSPVACAIKQTINSSSKFGTSFLPSTKYFCISHLNCLATGKSLCSASIV